MRERVRDRKTGRIRETPEAQKKTREWGFRAISLAARSKPQPCPAKRRGALRRVGRLKKSPWTFVVNKNRTDTRLASERSESRRDHLHSSSCKRVGLAFTYTTKHKPKEEGARAQEAAEK